MLHVLKYNNIKEVMNVAPNKINEDRWKKYLESYKGDSRYWWGCNFNELEEIVGKGWIEGLIKMEEFKNKLDLKIPPPEIKRKKKKFMGEGDEIIPERFYQGDIEKCWIGMQKVSAIQFGKMLTFKVCIANNSGTSSPQHFWTGTTCIVLTDILENIGYRVEIISFLNASRCTERGDDCYIEIPIKEHDQHLDKESLITVTALSGFFRFYLLKIIASFNEKMSSGFGRGLMYPPSDHYDRKKEYLISEIYSEDDAIWFINDIINKLEIKEVI